MTASGKQPPERSGGTRPRSFNLSFSFGQKPPIEDPSFQELLKEAEGQAAESPDGIGRASRRVASVELSDGTLRLGGRDGTLLELDLSEDRDQPPVDHYDPFPAVTVFRRWLQRTVIALAIGLPVAIILLCIFTRQTAETTFYLAFFGLVLSAMLVSSFFPRRTPLSRLTESLLTDAVRKSQQERAAKQGEENASPGGDANPAFTIKCQSCGASFTPTPPSAICPHCSTPALRT